MLFVNEEEVLPHGIMSLTAGDILGIGTINATTEKSEFTFQLMHDERPSSTSSIPSGNEL